MITLYETIKLHKTDGSISETVITHIYSKNGHFAQGGWHIELGSGVSPEDFVEVIDEGVEHEIPDSLPDVHIYDVPDGEATIEDYEAVIDEIFGGEDDASETDETTNTDAD